jgi:EAL domain-containing protein (putative c-di-GMP-specific phosphodiesterase class I)
MGLIRNIDRDKTRQAMVGGIVTTCATFNCRVIAEGVETVAERETLRTLGITLMQGHLFAMPGSNGVPEIARPRPLVDPPAETAPPPEGKRRSLH